MEFVSPAKQKNLFVDLAAGILCFMAVQEKGLPTVTDDRSQQFKQTYFLYTPQQMEIYFSNSKHLIIQGSYGSGKSLLGLKKLELISKSLGPDGKIIYVNFDPKSKLHFLMEQNVKRYARILPRKIKLISGIRDILQSPDQLIYVCHNNAGENLSTILQETVRLNTSTSHIGKTNYHLIVEEYDGETLTHDEAAKITELVEGKYLTESNVILLSQPLIKSRSWNLGKKNYEKKTCMFHELENTFKVVKLEEVLRCSNEICGITKSIQNSVRNKESVFKTKMLTFERRQNKVGNKEHMVSLSLAESNNAEVGTSSKFKTKGNEVSNPYNDINTTDKSLNRRIDLDQAFERAAPLQKSKAAKSKIVSMFDFLCEPKEGVDIKGLKPNLVVFSEDINLTSDMAVISLALVLKKFIGKNKATTLLHMADKQPRILKRTIQLLPKLLDEKFSYTRNIEEYLQKNDDLQMILSSNFRSVNGMEFDHVVIAISQSEYYLKYYLPQAISRCQFDLTLVLLPKGKMKSKKGPLQKFFSRTQHEKTNDIVVNMIEELKRKCLVKQVAVAGCEACEKSCDCYSISKEDDYKQKFVVHTHSGQYKEHLCHLAEYTDLEEQAHGTDDSALADAK